MRVVRILTVEDHNMTAIGYKYILEAEHFGDFRATVDIATSYELGKQKIKLAPRELKYDILLLDIQLFSARSKETETGEDLAVLARKVIPATKIVFMTSFNDSIKIKNVFKSIEPEGYMVKSEIDQKSLRTMVETVTNNKSYYSSVAFTSLFKKLINDFTVDKLDEKILYFLSIGTRTKDIAPLVSTAITTIETRKRQLKVLFGVENGNDIALIEAARDRGFL